MLKFTFKQLLGISAHIGHSIIYRTISVNRFLLGFRKKICIFNLAQSSFLLRRSLGFIIDVISKRGLIFFSANVLGKGFYGEPLNVKSWVGGSLTNMGRAFRSLKGNKYPYEYIPSALVLLTDDYNKYFIINESNRVKIPSVILTDSDMIPEMSCFPVPINDDMLITIHYFSKLFRNAVLRGLFKERSRIKIAHYQI